MHLPSQCSSRFGTKFLPCSKNLRQKFQIPCQKLEKLSSRQEIQVLAFLRSPDALERPVQAVHLLSVVTADAADQMEMGEFGLECLEDLSSGSFKWNFNPNVGIHAGYGQWKTAFMSAVIHCIQVLCSTCESCYCLTLLWRNMWFNSCHWSARFHSSTQWFLASNIMALAPIDDLSESGPQPKQIPIWFDIQLLHFPFACFCPVRMEAALKSPPLPKQRLRRI